MCTQLLQKVLDFFSLLKQGVRAEQRRLRVTVRNGVHDRKQGFRIGNPDNFTHFSSGKIFLFKGGALI